jgi:hypothetical protein
MATAMTPSEAKDIIRNARKYRADAESVLEDLDSLHQAAFKGFADDRNTARGDVVTLTAKDLRAALDAKKAMWQVVMDLHEVASAEAPDSFGYFVIKQDEKRKTPT